MLLISSGSSMTELIWAFLAWHLCARCPVWLHVKHLCGGHCLGGPWSVCAAFPWALLPLFPCCLGAHAWLDVSIGTTMLFIHGGALDKVTCCGTKPFIGCRFLGWKRGWLLLLLKHWKSGVFCMIELTSCINLTMAMSRLFIAPYAVGTGRVNTLSSKFLFLLNPLRKRLIASLDARL